MVGKRKWLYWGKKRFFKKRRLKGGIKAEKKVENSAVNDWNKLGFERFIAAKGREGLHENKSFGKLEE